MATEDWQDWERETRLCADGWWYEWRQLSWEEWDNGIRDKRRKPDQEMLAEWNSEVPRKTNPRQRLTIVLHGYGGNADRQRDLLPYLQPCLDPSRDLVYVPNGQYYTGEPNTGTADDGWRRLCWFDWPQTDSGDYIRDDIKVDANLSRDARPFYDFLDNIGQHGWSASEEVRIIGVSQGGYVALDYLSRRPPSFPHSVISIVGSILEKQLFAGRLSDESRPVPTKVLLWCGGEDWLVPPDDVRLSQMVSWDSAVLRDFDLIVEEQVSHSYPCNAEEAERLNEWALASDFGCKRISLGKRMVKWSKQFSRRKQNGRVTPRRRFSMLRLSDSSC